VTIDDNGFSNINKEDLQVKGSFELLQAEKCDQNSR